MKGRGGDGLTGEGMGLPGRRRCRRDHGLGTETGVSIQGVRNLGASSQEGSGSSAPRETREREHLLERDPLAF